MLTKKELTKRLEKHLEKEVLEYFTSQEEIAVFTQINEHDLNFSCNYIELDCDYYTTAGFQKVIDNNKGGKTFLFITFDWEALPGVRIDEKIEIKEVADILYSLQKNSVEIQNLIK